MHLHPCHPATPASCFEVPRPIRQYGCSSSKQPMALASKPLNAIGGESDLPRIGEAPAAVADRARVALSRDLQCAYRTARRVHRDLGGPGRHRRHGTRAVPGGDGRPPADRPADGDRPVRGLQLRPHPLDLRFRAHTGPTNRPSEARPMACECSARRASKRRRVAAGRPAPAPVPGRAPGAGGGRLAVASVGRPVLAGAAVLPRPRPGEDGPSSSPAAVRLGPVDEPAVTAAQLRDVVGRLITAGQ